ncbi:MAG: Gfo/Idh/MocA family oxidoreductase [Chloroflexota bacterium]|nr:Gfo/Idh/MocA family oxidoreductase [Chloroflexota bacterium]
MADKIRWGIISTARIGETAVIPAIHASRNGVVAAVASRDAVRGRAFADKNNIPTAYDSYEALIADPNIDAIYNPLPNGLHGVWSIRAAEGGKHVLCEKPLSNDAPEAERMAGVFADRGLILMEAFMYRYHPQIQTAKRLIVEGAIGTLHTVNASFSFALTDESNVRLNAELVGGALMDVGCYCVNVTRFLVGEEPVEVRAFADIGAQSGVDERLVGIMRFPGGALTHFDCGMRTHFTQVVEARGTHGRIVLEKAFVPFRPSAADDVVIRVWRSTPGVEQSAYEEIMVEKPNQYQLMVEDFGDAIRENRAPAYTIDDAIAQMRVIDMLYAAVR